MNQDSEMWKDNDELKDYRKGIFEQFGETISECVSVGADIGGSIGSIFGSTGEKIGRVVGAVGGAVVVFFKSIGGFLGL